MPGSGAVVTLTFNETDGRTLLTMNMRFESKKHRDFCLNSGMELGVKECFQKIDELLATL